MPADKENCELLLAVARWSAEGSAQTLHALAGSVRDWDALILLASQHRVLAMVYTRLSAVGATVPAAAHEQLKAGYERNAFHGLANAAELIAVLKAFEQESIVAMPFKGVVLGAALYGDLTTRSAGDIDVLIHYKDLLRATAILKQRGYELKTPVRKDGTPAISDSYEYHFERSADGMVLELRWRLELTYARYRYDLGLQWVWPKRQTTMLAGATVLNVDPETTMLVLCMHGSKHAWSRLSWICDVTQLLNLFPGLDWARILEEARRYSLWRALALGVLLAQRVGHAPVPPGILKRFGDDKTARRLAEHMQGNLFDAPGSVPSGHVPYNLQLLENRDRLRLLFSPMLFQPNERDRAFLPLPDSLHMLYYLIRPFRILLDRSGR